MYGNLHQDVAEDLDELANAARQRGRLADALAAAEESLRIRRAIYGNEHSLVAVSLNNLAVLRTAEGRYEEAAALHSQVIDLRRRLLGREHPRVALAVHNFAALQYFRGELQQAAASEQEALEQFRRILWRGPSIDADGAPQPRQLRSGAGSLRRGGSRIPIRLRLVGQKAGDGFSGGRGRAGQSGAHLSRTRRSGSSRAAPSRCGRTLAPSNGRNASYGRNLPQERRRRPGRPRTYDEAGRLLHEALDRLRAVYGTSHAEVAETLHELGQLARRRGDLAEAESRLGEALAMRRKLLGERHYLTAKSLAALGAARLAGNDPASARQPLEDAVVISATRAPRDHPLVVSATRDLERARQIRQGRLTSGQQSPINCGATCDAPRRRH